MDRLLVDPDPQIVTDYLDLLAATIPVYRKLNDCPGALILIEKAFSLIDYRKHDCPFPDGQRFRFLLLQTETLLDAGSAADALVAAGEALEFHRSRISHHPNRSEVAVNLADLTATHAIILSDLDRHREAVDVYRRAVSLFQALPAGPQEPSCMQSIAGITANKAVSEWYLGRFENAETDALTAVRRFDDLVEKHGRRECRERKALVMITLANIYIFMNRCSRAADTFESSRKIIEELLFDEGRDDLRIELAKLYMNYGNLLKDHLSITDCFELYHQGIRILKPVIRLEGRSDLRHFLAMLYMNLAEAYLLTRRHRRAIKIAREAAELLETLVFSENHREFTSLVVLNTITILKSMSRLGMHTEALDLSDRIIKKFLWEEVEPTMESALILIRRADLSVKTGDIPQARRDLERISQMFNNRAASAVNPEFQEPWREGAEMFIRLYKSLDS